MFCSAIARALRRTTSRHPRLDISAGLPAFVSLPVLPIIPRLRTPVPPLQLTLRRHFRRSRRPIADPRMGSTGATFRRIPAAGLMCAIEQTSRALPRTLAFALIRRPLCKELRCASPAPSGRNDEVSRRPRDADAGAHEGRAPLVLLVPWAALHRATPPIPPGPSGSTVRRQVDVRRFGPLGPSRLRLARCCAYGGTPTSRSGRSTARTRSGRAGQNTGLDHAIVAGAGPSPANHGPTPLGDPR